MIQKKHAGDKVRVLIIGGGPGGKAMLELFAESEGVRVVGLVDIKECAPGMERAKALGVPTSNSWKDFLAEGKVDVIVDVTSVLKVHETLKKEVSETCDLIAGKVAHVLWSLVDKYEHQRNYLNSVINALPHPFYVINVSDYTVAMANTVTRHGSEEGVVTCYALTHGRSTPCSREHPCPVEEIKRTGKSVVVEHVHIDGEGRNRNVEVHASPLFDAKGNLDQVIEYSVDITDRKYAEVALKDGEEKFRVIFDCSNDGMILVDPEDKVIRIVNKKLCDVLGYSEKELLNLSVSDIHPKEELPYVFEQFERQALGEIEVAQNIPMLRKDGSVFYADINSTPVTIEGKSGLLGIFRDITDRKYAEEAAWEKAFMMDSVSAIIGRSDLDGKMTYVNPAFLDNWGYDSIEEVLGRPFTEFWMLGDRAKKVMMALVGDGAPGRWSGELDAKRKDGSLLELLVSAATVYDSSGEPIALMSTSIDITDRKRVEDELKTKLDENEKFNRLMVGREGRIVEVKHEVNALLEELGREPKYAG
jgi:PAS domain S-box-containing protein